LGERETTASLGIAPLLCEPQFIALICELTACVAGQSKQPRGLNLWKVCSEQS